MPATARPVDMTNVKEGGKFNKKHVPAGDYRARIVDVEDADVKNQDSNNYGKPAWVFTVQLREKKYSSAKYPYHCTLVEEQLWKVRNLCVAAGMTVPKKRVKIDPNKLIGKDIGVTLDDTEYKDKMQSEITSVFPASELNEEESDDEPEADDVDEEEEEEVEPEPEPEPATRRVVKKTTATRRAAKPAPPADEDELDELDIDDV